MISLKCSWIDIGVSLESCTPPSCPAAWTDLGAGCAGMGVSKEDVIYTIGYCERWCKE